MNTLQTNAETSDELDQLFSDFFKGQLKQPWPNAPVPSSGASASTGAKASSEPSGLVASRAADSPRNTTPAPHARGRDSTARARFTLAASVALMLGTCWYLSNGYQPGTRSEQIVPTPGPPTLLQNGGASGTDDLRLKKIEEDKAKGILDNGGTKMDAGKFE
jgi:hypothetical protein